MDDLSQKLNQILSDPESMEKVRQMAEGFLGNNSSFSQQSENKNTNGENFPSGEEIGAIMSVLTKLKNQGEDNRTHLLNSLKPYLSESRQSKAENAIKILKLLEILPLIKDSGLFKF